MINHERHHRKGLTTCHIGIAEHDLRADGSGAPCGFGSGKADNRGICDAANWNGGLENSVAQSMAMAMGRGANAGLVRPNHWRVWWRVFNGSNGGGGMMSGAEARGSASSPARRSGRGRLGASRCRPTMSAIATATARDSKRQRQQWQRTLFSVCLGGRRNPLPELDLLSLGTSDVISMIQRQRVAGIKSRDTYLLLYDSKICCSYVQYNINGKEKSRALILNLSKTQAEQAHLLIEWRKTACKNSSNAMFLGRNLKIESRRVLTRLLASACVVVQFS